MRCFAKKEGENINIMNSSKFIPMWTVVISVILTVWFGLYFLYPVKPPCIQQIQNIQVSPAVCYKSLGAEWLHITDWENCLKFQTTTDCTESDPDYPPCTAKVLKYMLFSFREIMEDLDLEYWIAFGTLLGAVRDQKIIPWTIDIDIGMRKEILLKASKKMRMGLQAKGLDLFMDRFGEMHRVCISDRSGLFQRWKRTEKDELPYFELYPYLDVYPLVTIDNDKWTYDKGADCRYPDSEFFPLSMVTLLGKRFPGPAKPDKHLTQLYGKDYILTPPPENRSIHWLGHCKRIN